MIEKIYALRRGRPHGPDRSIGRRVGRSRARRARAAVPAAIVACAGLALAACSGPAASSGGGSSQAPKRHSLLAIGMRGAFSRARTVSVGWNPSPSGVWWSVLTVR